MSKLKTPAPDANDAAQISPASEAGEICAVGMKAAPGAGLA
ncbi:MAG: hypothetical protein ABSF95_11305 [Verrucomicrobiota bacterium]